MPELNRQFQEYQRLTFQNAQSQERANTLFSRFIDMPGRVSYDGNEFIVKIRKRAHTPILMGIHMLMEGISIPWLKQ